ncbi:MAG: hypothetical protein KME29_08720 [Calothrix sp. FI2-JRJ7]|nr:hypothetical protein [Calothrix sp. FI2-JRJ7]
MFVIVPLIFTSLPKSTATQPIPQTTPTLTVQANTPTPTITTFEAPPLTLKVIM